MRFEPHPDANLLSACWEGRLGAEERERVLHHLSVCDACRQITAQARAACHQCGSEALQDATRLHPATRAGWSGGAWAAAAVLASAAGLGLAVWLPPLHSAPPAAAPAHAGAPAATASMVKLHAWAAAPAPPPARSAEAKMAAPPPRTLAVIPSRSPSFPRLPAPAATSEIEPAIDFSPLMTGFQDQPPLAGLAGQASAELTSWTGAARVLPQPATDITPSEPPAQAADATPVWPFAEGFAGGAAAAAPSGPLAPMLPVAGLGWAISRGGQVLRSIGAGVWAAVPLVPGVRIGTLFSSQNAIWAGGRADQLYLSSDNGSHWRQVRLPGLGAHPPQLASIAFSDHEHGLVTASDGTLWTTTDGGRTWTKR